MTATTDILDAVLSTGKDDWQTPPWLFALLSERFGPFHVDAASSEANHLAPLYIDERKDALSLATSWRQRSDGEGRVFLNPPYSDPLLGKFLARAVLAAREEGVTVVVLMPSTRMSTAYFRPTFRHAASIHIIEKRVPFVTSGDAKSGNTQGSMVVVLTPESARDALDRPAVGYLDEGRYRPTGKRKKARLQ